jgi:hypothetical protein
VRLQGIQARNPELLFIARKLGYSVVEVPVTWGHDDRSRISYLKDGTKMIEEMVIIRFNAVVGRYNHAIATMKDTSVLVTARTPHVTKSKLRVLPL